MQRRVIIFPVLAILALAGCSTASKLNKLRSKEISAQINLPESHVPTTDYENIKVAPDTIAVTQLDGHEYYLMKTIVNDTGEAVASDVLESAIVVARFRNVAERHGTVDIQFEISVPSSMLDSKWQVRFFPEMKVFDNIEQLEPVYITGENYRKAQLKGYQQYQRFLNKIISDTTKFIWMEQLDKFIERNIPALYAYKHNQEEVSDEQFESCFGVTEQEAIEHFTLRHKIKTNNWRIANKERMYNKYIKSPIVTEGIRLDTVYHDGKNFVYNYVQTINARKQLKRVDVTLSGAIYASANKVYDISRTPELTYYISSVSTLVDNHTHYKTAVVNRQVAANTTCYIDFEKGRSEVKPALFNNASEISRIDHTLLSLLQNDVFDLDSLMISAYASPEGSVVRNKDLCLARSESVCKYFKGHMKHFTDSLALVSHYEVGDNGSMKRSSYKAPVIPFKPVVGGENWRKFDELVASDDYLSTSDKEFYKRCCQTVNLDAREEAVKSDKKFYSYCEKNIYPLLRTVRFDFRLHRRGMVKDTIHTTVVDTTYMQGIQAILDRDYDTAVRLLRPYEDYNSAIAFLGMDYNESAKAVLETLPRNANVDYMLAIVYSRLGKMDLAVKKYLQACEQDHAFHYRGNLDPEISLLIKTYGLNKEEF